jgi:hypothetical protein
LPINIKAQLEELKDHPDNIVKMVSSQEWPKDFFANAFAFAMISNNSQTMSSQIADLVATKRVSEERIYKYINSSLFIIPTVVPNLNAVRRIELFLFS